MINKKNILTSILVITLTISAGCTNTKIQNETKNTNQKQVEIVKKENKEKEIIEELDKLKKDNRDLDKIIKFVDENIQYVSKEVGSLLVNTLEETQNFYLQDFEDKFYSQEIQEAFIKAYKPNMDLDDIKDVDEKDLEELLIETKNKGYRVETAEGSYFPIVDYKFYEKYNTYVTEDMKEYIEIMAIESSNVPAKDAALVIEWDEVIKRATKQEQFIRQYPQSVKINKIKQLFSTYASYCLYGLNNTPIFDYDSNKFNEDAKKVYLENINSQSNSKLIQILKEFTNILEKNGYKLNKEIDNFRKEALDKL